MLTSVKLDPYGVVKDTNPLDVQDEWTDVLNMRFMDGAAYKFRGETILDGTSSQPYHLLFNGSHSTPKWYWMGDGSINVYDGTDVALTGAISAGTDWDASLFNQIPIFNNGADIPWVTLDDTAAIPLPGFLVDTCKAIRPYKSFLIAMNILDGVNDDGNRLVWSDSSDAGALPPSWAIDDPSTLAGDAYLTSERGEIIDGHQIRDHFALFKTHSTYLMTLVGGQSVMRIQKIQTESGILAKNCVAEFEGKLFIVADGDIVLFDGQNIKSIANKRVRNTIFGSIDSENYFNTYVARYSLLNEMWVCYPEKGKTWPNKAAVWQWEDNTWTFRDIGYAPHIASGVTNFTDSPVWDDVNVPWNSYPGAWQALSQNPTIDTLVKAGQSAAGTEINQDVGFDNIPLWEGTGTVSGSQAVIGILEYVRYKSTHDFEPGDIYTVDIDIAETAGNGVYVYLGAQVVGPITASGSYNLTVVSLGNFIGVQSNDGITTATINSLSVKRAANTGLYLLDETNDINGAAMPSRLEKVSMDMGDEHRVKFVNKLVPQITAPQGTRVWARLGVQMTPDEPISWQQEVLYTVGVDDHVSVLGQGRYISIKMRTEDSGLEWACHGVRIYTRGAGSE